MSNNKTDKQFQKMHFLTQLICIALFQVLKIDAKFIPKNHRSNKVILNKVINQPYKYVYTFFKFGLMYIAF